MASLAIALRLPLLLFRKPRNHKHNRKSSHSKDSDDQDRESHERPRLCNYHELPEWYRHQESPYIVTNYRPPSNSYHSCIHSLTYLHNETMNVWTHLLPAITLALALPLLQINISRIYADAPWMDRFMLTLTPMAALLTFSLSSTYHTLNNHSALVSSSCLLMDFAGILVLILCSFISGIYVGFYGYPFERKLYWTMIALLTLTSTLLVLHPRLQGPKFRPHRTSAFVLTVLSGLAPTFHGMYVHGIRKGFHECGVKWWLLEGICYGIGVLFFTSRFPERWGWSETGGDGMWFRRARFDVFGGSHQVFHICVVLGAACHCWGVWSAWGFAVRGS
ncbi:HlyIII-domain-containing protein [Byssothecium circinans]|uniref:HlyIII-domain-containing protein n=1 Tax=Byssothecium circinans TaxID=147558 RepID=A0A6A5TIX9_9PLEO|nr:HlyIII-domain-containing protein [Byssothecium circinans]